MTRILAANRMVIRDFLGCYDSISSSRRCRRTDLPCNFTVPNQNYSFSIWLRCLGTNTSASRIWEETSLTGSTYFSVIANGLSLNITVKNDSATKLNNINPGLPNLYDRKWHNFIWTDSNGTVKAYTDAVLKYSNSYTRDGVWSNTTRVGLGIEQNPANNYNTFAGYIDELTAFNVALSLDQVKDIYYRGSYLANSYKTIWLPFNEGTGTTIGDISGNSKDFTLNTATSAWKTNNFLIPRSLATHRILASHR